MMMDFTKTLIAGIAVVGLAGSASAASLHFDDVTVGGGTVSYDGVGGALRVP